MSTQIPAPSHLRYRPDIDGLRAIAVLLVFADHVRLPHLTGGFIGVDIFFVISGYLITGTIARSMAQGSFSLLGFYERRIRRILPALLALLAVLTPAVWLLLLPSDLIHYENSALSALFSYSNIYFHFLHHTGYFNNTVFDLLLHTWSLGVEEQFYLVFPLLMLLFRNRPRLRTRILILLAILSLIVATWFAFKNRYLAFYMPHTRAWELLCGAVAALGFVRLPASRRLREAIAATSLLLIALFVWRYDFAIPFPGLAALPICAAATALIVLGEHPQRLRSTAILSCRPMVFLGLISYSFYLWHWPLILIASMGVIPGIHFDRSSHLILLFLLTLSIATLSWLFVERPFRAGRWKKLPQRSIFITAGASAIALAAIAFTLRSHHGWPSRFSPEATRVSAYSYESILPTMSEGTCFNDLAPVDFAHSQCLTPLTPQDIALIGDSHAAALWQGLQSNLPGQRVMLASMAGCPPMKRSSYNHSACYQFSRYVYEDYLPAHPANPVIFIHHWPSARGLPQMKLSLDWFVQHKTPAYIVGPGPVYEAPLPYLLALSLKFHDPAIPSRSRNTPPDLDEDVRSAIARYPGLRYVSIWNALCPHGICQLYAEPAHVTPLMIDKDHLSTAGALLLSQRLQSTGELPPQNPTPTQPNTVHLR